jgi:1-deoxy-D-xylulose-5-phosphate synthase
MVFPDRFIDHNSPAAQIIEAGLSAKDMVGTALRALGLSQPRHALQPVVPAR